MRGFAGRFGRGLVAGSRERVGPGHGGGARPVAGGGRDVLGGGVGLRRRRRERERNIGTHIFDDIDARAT